MANISTYPIGTPAAADLVPGTQLYTDSSGKTRNLTKNFSVSSIAAFANSYSLGYTVYVASLIQAGTAAPVATVLQNTTGGTFTWSRTSTGKYKATISGITLPANKVVIFENATNDLNLGGKITSTTVIDVEQFSSGGGGYSDVMLPGTSIEIRIYS
tara:strand:+ start:920 stop:1390 length:471 start_codon:yes stop_codon:yes gene_type:complete